MLNHGSKNLWNIRNFFPSNPDSFLSHRTLFLACLVIVTLLVFMASFSEAPAKGPFFSRNYKSFLESRPNLNRLVRRGA